MPNIQLVSVENLITRKGKATQQQLSFLIRIENLGYDKQVDVVWAGEDDSWQTLPTRFLGKRGENQELWLAEITFRHTSKKPLPGKVKFCLRYKVNNQEFWDNNHGRNYTSEAGSGLRLANGIETLNIQFTPRLTNEQKTLPVAVAVDPALNAVKVIIHWTTDNWRQSYRTPCFLPKSGRQKPPNTGTMLIDPSAAQVWRGRLTIRNAFKVQYCIEFIGKIRTVWDNNGGINYTASRKPLAVMILNLHCYQEDHQDFKFSQIAKAITEQDADIVCLQEVAEHWNNGEGDWQSNAARIINSRLPKPYHLYTDWSHLGFDKFREGVAILSRLPFLHTEARYVSDSNDIYNIHSRKVVMAQINLPYLGFVNLFSAHLSWIEDGFKEQFQRLREWAESLQTAEVKATLLCGDFNIAAGSEGYRLVVDSHRYEDQFLAANSPGVFEKIFKVNDPHWRDYLAEDYRIDYVFMNNTSELAVTSGAVLFTEQDYGRVSDHCGYLLTFEPKSAS